MIPAATGTPAWTTWLWIALVGVASLALSRAFACATPFAALATLAAFTLAHRQAAALVLFVWLANQAIGFGLLHYPRDATTLAWGFAIGFASLAGLGAASAVAHGARRSPWAAPLGLLAAFAAYELVLLGTSRLLSSGTGAFTAAIVLRLFAINAARARPAGGGGPRRGRRARARGAAESGGRRLSPAARCRGPPPPPPSSRPPSPATASRSARCSRPGCRAPAWCSKSPPARASTRSTLPPPVRGCFGSRPTATTPVWRVSRRGGTPPDRRTCWPRCGSTPPSPLAGPVERADAVVAINMVHIAPWAAAQGLVRGRRPPARRGRRAVPLRSLSRSRGRDRAEQSGLRCQPARSRPGVGASPPRRRDGARRATRPRPDRAHRDAGQQPRPSLPAERRGLRLAPLEPHARLPHVASDGPAFSATSHESGMADGGGTAINGRPVGPRGIAPVAAAPGWQVQAVRSENGAGSPSGGV